MPRRDLRGWLALALPGTAPAKGIDRTRGTGTADHAAVVGSGEMGWTALPPRIRRLTSAVGYIEVDAPADGLAAAFEGARFFRAHSR